MRQTSLLSKLREMDADELQEKGQQLLMEFHTTGITNEKYTALCAIPAMYRQMTGEEIELEIPARLVS